jgi:hypothetical protein
MPASGFEHAIYLAVCPIQFRHVLEHITGKHHVRARRSKAECLQILVARAVGNLAELGPVASVFRTLIAWMRLQPLMQ